MILWGYIAALAYAGVCVLLGSLARKLGLPKPYSRKIVHVTVGLEWVILYHFMGTSVHFLIVCLLCFAFLFVSYVRGWFSFTMGSDGDNAPGTVYYAVSMSLMATVTLIDAAFILPFGIAVACTSLGDGAAGIVGQAVRRHNPRIYKSKSLFGTAATAIVCALCTLGFSLYFSMHLPWQAIVYVGLLAAGVELLSIRGLDNIFVPLTCSTLVYAYICIPWINAYALPLAVTPFIIAFAVEKRALTTDGLIAAVVLDIVLTLTLGNNGFLILCMFFLLGIACDAFKKHQKQDILHDKEAKGSRRDAVQVAANAAPAAVMAVLYAATGQVAFVAAFVASMAEALGDTAASGIGVLSRRAYDLFHARPCERGMSGGVSLLGTTAALLGCVAVSFVGCALFAWPLWQGCVIAAIAFVGTFLDSMLGSLCQLRYRCEVCGRQTERRVHCDTQTVRIGGRRPFTNDVVNACSTAFSAVVAAAMFMFVV